MGASTSDRDRPSYARRGGAIQGADTCRGGRLVDEVISDAPSLAVRVGGIIGGDYDTGYINSLGDGGNGYEISVIAGKFLGDRVGLSGELGYRDRDSDIPSEVFANVSALWF